MAQNDEQITQKVAGFIERLNKDLEKRGYNGHRLSKQMTRSDHGIRNILNGKAVPGVDFLLQYHQVFPDVDLGLLLTGRKEETASGDDVVRLNMEVSRQGKQIVQMLDLIAEVREMALQGDAQLKKRVDLIKVLGAVN